MVGVSEGWRRLASSVVSWARRRSKRPSLAMGSRKRRHVEGTVVGGVGVAEELAQAGLALLVMPYTLRLRFSSRRPDRRTRQRARNPLLRFIAVRLVLLEDPEDRHLDHEGKSIGERLPAHGRNSAVVQALSIWCSPSVCFRCSARLRWSCTPTYRLDGRRLSGRGRSCVGWCLPVGRDLVCGRRGGGSSRW